MQTKIKSKPYKLKNYRKYPFMNLSLDDMDGEKWVDIPECDGYLKVSNYGRVWSLARPIQLSTGQFYYTKERIRKQTLAEYYNSHTRDYTEQLSVHIRYGEINTTYKVNRLVYALFVKPISFKDDGLLVVHLDGDNCNNRVENLALMNGTQLYRHGLKIERRPRTGLKMKKRNQVEFSDANSPRPVVQYTLDGKAVHEYESIGQAAKLTGAHRASIRSVVMKRARQLHGFVYRFKGDRYKGEHAAFSWEKQVTQYSVEGKKIAVYPSVKEASIRTGIDANTISKCALRKCRLASGYVWRYPGDTYRGEFKGKITNIARAITQYSLDGKRIADYASANMASLQTGFSAATLLDCANKKTKVSHGFVWRFNNDTYKGEYKNYQRGKPVTQFTKEGKKISSYPSIEAAASATGLTPDNIQKNVKGENKTAGGFVWRDATEAEVKSLPAFEPTRYTRQPAGGKTIVQYSLEGKKLAHYTGIAEAARACKMNPSNISSALDKEGTSGGYVWRTKGNRYYGELAKLPHSNKARTVTQYSLQGRKIRVFKSTKEAEAHTKVSSGTISAVANGKLKTTGGFIWRYGDGPKKIDTRAYFASTREIVRKISKPVVKYSLEGEFLNEYPSIAAAARAEGVSVSRISSAINGQTKSAIGFYWRLKNTAKARISK